MNKIKHSKYKNSGLLFELLVHQITADTLKGIDSPSISLIKKYFTKTELGKEYKLYESIMKSQNLNDTKASILLNESLESSKKLNKRSLKSLKYNLIKEIREHYDLDQFFTSKIKNYKQLASLYVLIESANTDCMSDPEYITSNKMTLLEHITKKDVIKEVKETELEELNEDKDLRILTYKILLENFNEKYDGLNNNQKNVLKEFINSMDSVKELREIYNKNVVLIKGLLEEQINKVKDKTVLIKLNEVKELIKEADKSTKINNEDMISLLQYYDLTEELKLSHNEIL